MSLLELLCAVDDCCQAFAPHGERHRIDATDRAATIHLVVNELGELLAVHLTPGNVDDRKPVPPMAKRLFGKGCPVQIYSDWHNLAGSLHLACRLKPQRRKELSCTIY